MRLLFPFLILAAASHAAAEMRCGWIDRPAIGAYVLEDRDGPWQVNTQNGYQVQAGVPDPLDGEFVATGGWSNGFFCGCLDAIVDLTSRQIVVINSSFAKKISECVKDPNLKSRSVPAAPSP